MSKVKDAIKRLQGYDPESHVAMAVWTEADVIGYAKQEMATELKPEQAREILDDIENHQDAELGITWLTIRCAIELLGFKQLFKG